MERTLHLQKNRLPPFTGCARGGRNNLRPGRNSRTRMSKLSTSCLERITLRRCPPCPPSRLTRPAEIERQREPLRSSRCMSAEVLLPRSERRCLWRNQDFGECVCSADKSESSSAL